LANELQGHGIRDIMAARSGPPPLRSARSVIIEMLFPRSGGSGSLPRPHAIANKQLMIYSSSRVGRARDANGCATRHSHGCAPSVAPSARTVMYNGSIPFRKNRSVLSRRQDFQRIWGVCLHQSQGKRSLKIDGESPKNILEL